MLTFKERHEMALANLEVNQRAELGWVARDLPGYLIIVLWLLIPLTAALAWHYAGERAREEHQGKMIALLVNLGADPIKARCAVEKITADNRQICEKLAKE